MSDQSDEGKGKKKGGVMKLVIVAVVVALVAGGGAFVFLGKGKKAEGAEGAAKKEKEEKVELGAIVPIEPMTVNLADGHYLKVGIALQVIKAPKHAGGGHGGMEDMVAKAQDAAITLFGETTMSQLRAHGGRDKAKAKLTEEVKHLYEGDVVGIYFTEFVMQ